MTRRDERFASYCRGSRKRWRKREEHRVKIRGEREKERRKDKRESIFRENAKERRKDETHSDSTGSNCISTPQERKSKRGTERERRKEHSDRLPDGQRVTGAERGGEPKKETRSIVNLNEICTSRRPPSRNSARLETSLPASLALPPVPRFLDHPSWISIEKQFVLCQRACRANWFRLIPAG